ncbi:MAG: succinate dehydrogenase, hydrophobic membrane anchor protein [Thiobacillaceae bacterium]
MKRAVTVSHSGTGWWLAQRVSAAIIVFTGGPLFVGYWCCAPYTYASWHGVFESTLIQLSVWLLVACLCLHAWVGIRDVLMDYVKPVGGRLTLTVLMTVALVMCVVWTTRILWGVHG